VIERWQHGVAQSDAAAEDAGASMSDAVNAYFDQKFARRIKTTGVYTTHRR
jgi:hypothetical protein